MEPHVRKMLIRWPPILGLVGLVIALPIGRLVFGSGHPDGSTVGLLFAIALAPILGLTSGVFAITEPRSTKFPAVHDRKARVLLYIVDALLILVPIAFFFILTRS
jgi:hypothetical protein